MRIEPTTTKIGDKRTLNLDVIDSLCLSIKINIDLVDANLYKYFAIRYGYQPIRLQPMTAAKEKVEDKPHGPNKHKRGIIKGS